MSILGEKISVLYQYVMGYLPTPVAPELQDSKSGEKAADTDEEIVSPKMSDQDLISFDGGEGKNETADDKTPEMEVTSSTSTEENIEITENMTNDSLENEITDVKSSIVSTATIDLNISETASPKQEAEEESDIKVEFEQLDLTPVTRSREISIPNDLPKVTEHKLMKAAKRITNNHAAESKIAMEIREMRQREEELKQMREKINSQPKPQPEIVSESLQSDGSTKSEDFMDDGRSSPNVKYVAKNNITRAISLDSLHVGQTYNIGYAFGHRRKDQIKVKPLEDGNEEEVESKHKYRALKESPIEREIRQLREREEALKKEKGVVESRVEKRQIQRSEKVTKTSEPVVNHADTQRILATSRIQQEIEEQTKREMALRESGHIQTISQERTDSKVTKIREAVASPSESSVVDRKQSPSPTIEIYEKTNGHLTNGTGKSPSSPPSSNCSISSVPLGRRACSPQTPPGKGVSMQRFIKSKGKDIGYNTFSNSLYTDNGCSDYYEFRPPQVRKVNGCLGTMIPRRTATAESKIQEELKEMKEREEELKRQRARLLGLSQPNLSSLISDEDIVTNGDTEEVHLDRANSNPNILEDNQDLGVTSGRRKSALIAQWEQRIQKAEVKS